MAIISDNISKKICEMFGLDSKDVSAITIRLAISDVGKVIAEMHITKVQAEGLKEVLKEYKLEPK